MYSVKNVKTFKGRDFEGYNATLYRDGVRVAECINDGNGGETFIRWFDYTEPRVLFPVFVNARRNETTEVNLTPEEALFFQYCYSLPDSTLDVEGLAREPMVNTPDIVIDDMVNEYENKRRFKRLCKNNTLFRIAARTYEEGSWDSLKVPFSQDMKQRIINRYGACEFLNETI